MRNTWWIHPAQDIRPSSTSTGSVLYKHHSFPHDVPGMVPLCRSVNLTCIQQYLYATSFTPIALASALVAVSPDSLWARSRHRLSLCLQLGRA